MAPGERSSPASPSKVTGARNTPPPMGTLIDWATLGPTLETPLTQLPVVEQQAKPPLHTMVPRCTWLLVLGSSPQSPRSVCMASVDTAKEAGPGVEPPHTRPPSIPPNSKYPKPDGPNRAPPEAVRNIVHRYPPGPELGGRCTRDGRCTSGGHFPAGRHAATIGASATWCCRDRESSAPNTAGPCR